MQLLALAFAFVMICGCTTPQEHPKEKDTDGDGIPDSKDQFPDKKNWGVNLTFLDDTKKSEGVYELALNVPEDAGIILVDNCGMVNDTFMFKIDSAPSGWTVTLENDEMAVSTTDVLWNEISFKLPSGASGTHEVKVNATSKGGNVSQVLTLICVVKGEASVALDGAQCVVKYVLTDTSGAEIDSGRIPVKAGDDPNLIEGFYLGVVGMSRNEEKKIRVPPELAYGTDPAANELGGQVLIFDLTMIYFI